MASTMSAEQSRFIKQLVSTDKLVREKASRTFLCWIQANQGLDLMDSRKLWKGLFYGMWSADKSAIQEQLGERLTSVILTLESTPCVLHYLEAFWNIMAIEWNGIDRFRLDKFYMLMKKCLFYTFRWLEYSQWNEALVTDVMNIFVKFPLCMDDRVCPDGIRLFLAEYFFTQGHKGLESTKELSESVTKIMWTPFLHVIANYPKPHVVKKMDLELFNQLKDLNDFIPKEHLIPIIFKFASKKETLESRRTLLYTRIEQLKN